MEKELELNCVFKDICRLCLKDGLLQLLANEKLNISLSVLNFVEAQLHHKLPESACQQCLQEFVQITNFIKKCQHSERILTVIETECEKISVKSETKIEILECKLGVETEFEQCILPDNVTFKRDSPVEFAEEVTESINKCEIKNTISVKSDSLLFDDKIEKPIENVVVSEEHHDNNGKILLSSKSTTPLKVCPQCGKSVTTTMKEHYKLSKTCFPKNFKCQHCDKCFKTNSQRRNHNIAHHGHGKSPEFMCHICSKMFKFKENLRRHIVVHKFGKRFTCETCGKAYTTNVQLNEHMNLHTGAKPFACSFCKKTFSVRSDRVAHEVKHRTQIKEETTSGEALENSEYLSQPFVECHICHRVFSSESGFKRHMMVHNSNRIFKCKLCENSFCSQKLLRTHVNKIHRTEKPFACSQCGKGFKLRSCLEIHMRSHTGERPYLCSVCMKSFTQSAHLNYHMLHHQDEKLFKCDVCEKRFTLKGNLTVHKRLHTGERPYMCHVCKKSFCDSSNRKKHVLTQHGRNELKNIQSVNSN